MRHTIRFPNSWQGWGNLRFANLPPTFSQWDIDCAGIRDELHAVVSDYNTGNIWHTIRRASSSWTSWQQVVPGNTVRAFEITCASIGNELHVFALNSSGPELFHTIRPGTIHWTPWRNIRSQVTSPRITISTLDAAGVGNEIHLIVQDGGGYGQINSLAIIPNLYHAIREANGSWHSTWVDVLATVPGTPTDLIISGSSCAGIGNELHVVISDAFTGKLWHTIRLANGNWTPWGDIMLATTPATGEIAHMPLELAPLALDLDLVDPTLSPMHNMPLAKHQRIYTSPLLHIFPFGGR